MTEEVLKVEIMYKNAQGERMWPKPLYIKKEDALKYPVHIVKHASVKLRMIPIKDLREYIYDAS